MFRKDKHEPAPPVTPTPAPPAPATDIPPAHPAEPDLKQLQDRAAKADENWDKYLRACADLENYRKRALREKEESARYVREQMVSALLPTLDNLERALAHSPANTPLHDGLLQVQSQLKRSLGEFGLVENVVAAGQLFDPQTQEAVSHADSTVHPDGVVIEALQNGYQLAGKLIRPARVVVSNGTPAPVAPAA
jgi:molecular chaperone GrpE